MNRRLPYRWLCVIALATVLASCSPNKFLSEDQKLYRGSEITYKGPELEKNPKRLSEKIQKRLSPKPNKKFLGLFYTKIWFHEKVKPNPNKEKSFKHWLKNKLGEEPVLITDVDTSLMVRIVEKTMQDHGYFHTVADPEIKAEKRQARIRYEIRHNGPSRLGPITLPSGGRLVDSLARSWDKYTMKEGDIYELKDFESDRLGVSRHIRSYGFYDFSEKYLLFLIDTARLAFPVNMRIKQPEGDSLHRRYFIRDVDVYPTYEGDVTADSLDFRRSIKYKYLDIHQNYEFMGRKSLYKINLIEPGEPFSVAAHEATVNRLVNTGIFRYVNVNYTKIGRDSLDVDVLLTPAPYQGIKVDVEASTSNRSFLGSLVALSYTNDNLFRGAERFSLKISAGTDFQFINEKAQLNTINLNLDARLEVPGLLTFLKKRKNQSEKLPVTYLDLNEEFQKWLQFYTLNSLKFGGGYQWSKRNFTHDVEMLFMEWVALLDKTNRLDNLLDENPQLRESFRNNMIFGRSYTFSVATSGNDRDRSVLYYTGSGEATGNIAYLTARILKKDADRPYKVLGIPFSNYFKFDNELRHHWNISPKMTLASRVSIGLGIAFGNSEVLPFVRQYYMGGPNTIRAFEFRSVGPGRFSPDDDDEVSSVTQSGDIKLLLNLEYRFQLYRFLHGAVFVDAGNVWLRKEDPDRPGAKIDPGSFYRELAVGTGLGIRLDFDFFALRVDMGVPVYKPFNEDGERWLPTFPETGFREWRKANWAWNIAIGYPF